MDGLRCRPPGLAKALRKRSRRLAEGLMNRSRGLAEGVVVMVCPVLLALALDKVDLKVYGRRTFTAMLTMAGLTLISGICPVLVCSFCQIFPDVPYLGHEHVTASLATLSSSCLLVLACIIAQLIVSKKILIAVGALFGAFVLVRAIFYYLQRNVVPNQLVPRPELHHILDESFEFLTGLTGILFLGLEGLALQSNDNQMIQKGGGALGTISLIVCTLGVCLMYFEFIPPRHFDRLAQIVSFTLVLDFLMAAGTFALLMVAMFMLMGVPALMLFTPPVIIIGELAYRVIIGKEGGNQANHSPASIELTRVTFTGFLAVSITSINNTSSSMLTVSFLLFAAVAIVFGISWRLLTQSHIRSGVGASPGQLASSANLASLCTHISIVIATILFLAMAGTAGGN